MQFLNDKIKKIMIVGRVLITNGFHSADDDSFFLSCELIYGEIKNGNKLVVDEKNRYSINNVEIPIKEFPLNIIIRINKKDIGKINIAEMYNNIYCFEN